MSGEKLSGVIGRTLWGSLSAQAAGAATFTAVSMIAAALVPPPHGDWASGLALSLDGMADTLGPAALLWIVFSFFGFFGAIPLTILASPVSFVLVSRRVTASTAVGLYLVLGLLFAWGAIATKGQNGIAHLAYSDGWVEHAGFPLGFTLASAAAGVAYGWALWRIGIAPSGRPPGRASGVAHA